MADSFCPVRSVGPLLLAVAIAAVVVAADAAEEDAEIERFLSEAEIVGIERVMTSTTYPMALRLKLEGTVGKAAFKYGHSESEDVAGVRHADSYRHDIAAYRVDRLLGLDLVAVAVHRDVRGQPGAVIQWISDAVDVDQYRADGPGQAETEQLERQLAEMKVFDALILNLDRDSTDQLVTLDDRRLRLIDHSRGFGESTELPETFVSEPVRVPRSLLSRLQKLEAEGLRKRVEGLLSDAQIQAMLERRDEILAKFETDRGRFGDATVFRD